MRFLIILILSLIALSLNAQIIKSNAIMELNNMDFSTPCSSCSEWRYSRNTNFLYRWNGTSWIIYNPGSTLNLGLSMPGIFNVSPSTLTGSGTFNVTLNSQAQNTFLAAPSNASGVPSFRTLTPSDLSVAGGLSGTSSAGRVAFYTGTSTLTGDANLTWDNSDKSLSLGGSGVSSSLLTLNSTTKGILIPRMTTTEKNAIVAPATGLLVYDLTLGAFNVYNGSAWVSVGGGLPAGSNGQIQFNNNNVFGASSNLFWDAANSRLGIGTTTPASSIETTAGIRLSGSGVQSFEFSNATRAQFRAIFGGFSFRSSTGVLISNSDGDPAARLHIRGTGTTSATTSLLVQNSAATNIFTVLDNGFVRYGNSSLSPLLFPHSNASGSVDLAGTNMTYYSYTTSQSSPNGRFAFAGDIQTQTSGSNVNMYLSNRFSPTSGTATNANLLLESIINQTGQANGITRGLLVNANLTSAADWRSIEWSNNTGWGLYGAGTANNYLAGRLAIGSTTTTNGVLSINTNLTGSATQRLVYLAGSIRSDVTGNAYGIQSSISTESAAFTLINLHHFQASQNAIGAGSSVLNQYGFSVDAGLTGAVSNIGFYGNIPSGTGRWNLYMNGTADNYIAGNTGIGLANFSDRLTVRGSTTDNTANAFGIQNSGARLLLAVRNDGLVNLGRNTAVTTQEVAQINIVSDDTNTGLVITPKGTGAFILGPAPDGGTAGGNARGANAVDLQVVRSATNMVASGLQSVISGGAENRSTGSRSTVSGGFANNASGSSAVVSGGVLNTAIGQNSVVGGGSSNNASGAQSTIAGGQSNYTSNTNATISGGLSNSANGIASAVVGGQENIASASYSVAEGVRARSYLYGQSSTSSGYFTAISDNQTSNIRLRNTISNATTELFLDGSSDRAVLTPPSGNTSRVWNARLQCVAVTNVQGTGGPAEGSVFSETMDITIKRIGSVTSIVNGTPMHSVSVSDVGMSGADFLVDADDTNEALRIRFQPPTIAASDTQIRAVCTVYLTEIGY